MFLLELLASLLSHHRVQLFDRQDREMLSASNSLDVHVCGVEPDSRYADILDCQEGIDRFF